jgi:hypothetical protein
MDVQQSRPESAMSNQLGLTRRSTDMAEPGTGDELGAATRTVLSRRRSYVFVPGLERWSPKLAVVLNICGVCHLHYTFPLLAIRKPMTKGQLM